MNATEPVARGQRHAEMTSLAELAFEMEFEEGAAAEPGAAPLMHSAWTESEALEARHSTGWASGRPASLDSSEGAEEPGCASPVSPAARDVCAQSPVAAAQQKPDAYSFQCVTDALFDFEFEPCPELDAIYAKYQQARRQEAAAGRL